MQIIPRYMLTIHDLFTITDLGICGAEIEVAILDCGVEIDRIKFQGKCQSEDDYSHSNHANRWGSTHFAGLAARFFTFLSRRLDEKRESGRKR
ncbi:MULTISPECIES: hypothetical protein [Pseudomonas]|uniref:Peptidase S8/S53 domain-containing protein n=1 Tax=Pseudomonas syringae pv. syringae TaxID=321 RepID=A0AB35JGW5_PSESY|nr:MULTISPECIES: hypothetical protein [Pseudomonas]MDC3735402.1 hypothetical protein [Pseudomonas syringae pv. syringae]